MASEKILLDGLVVETRQSQSYAYATINLYNRGGSRVTATVEVRYSKYSAPRVGKQMKLVLEDD